MKGCDVHAEGVCKLTTNGGGFCNPSFEVFSEDWLGGFAKYQLCHLIWCAGCEGGKVQEACASLEFSSELCENHLGGWAMTNNVHFVPQYSYACSKAVRAHSVFVVHLGMCECIMKLRRYNVDSVLCADPQKF